MESVSHLTQPPTTTSTNQYPYPYHHENPQANITIMNKYAPITTD